MWLVCVQREMQTKFRLGNPTVIHQLEDMWVDGIIVQKWNLNTHN